MSDSETDVPEELTPEEMQDIVVVAIASTVPEAIFLSDTLEDAEIPVVSRNDNTQGLTSRAYETRICVPRALQARAKEIVAKARGAAEDQKVQDAFSPETVAETTRDADKDPFLQRMFLLRDTDPAARTAALEAFAKECLTSSMQPVDIARYLAAAGLDLQQSNTLLEHVHSTYSQEIAATRAERRTWGMILIAMSLVVVVLEFLIFAWSHAGVVMILLPTGMMSSGLWYLVSSSQPLPKLHSTSASDPPA